MGRLRGRRLTLAVMAAIIGIPLLPNGEVRADGDKRFEDLAVCINEKRALDVLMLVDESKSLRESDGEPGNDPDDKRVEALISVVEVLKSSMTASAGMGESPEAGLRIRIGISGFGSKYTEHLVFTELDDSSVESIRAVLREQANRDDQKYTRYHEGLKGARDSFRESSDDPCRTLMWFSDGQHDDDNAKGFNSKERDQIEEVVCGEGGLVDELRSDGVFIVAAGLNKKAKELGLLRMIAAGDEPYVSDGYSRDKNARSVRVEECGEIRPFGSFQLASDADQIVDSIFAALTDIPGVPDPDGDATLTECVEDSGTVCKELSFTADDTISAFNVLASRSSSNVEVTLQGPDFSSRVIMGTSASQSPPSEVDIVRFTNVSENRVLISARASKSRSLAGEWRLSFNGPDAANSKGSVSFIGQAEVVLDPAPTDRALKINRFKAVDLAVRVAPTARAMDIRRIVVTMSAGAESKWVPVEPLAGSFRISRSTFESILQVEPFGSISNLQLTIQPEGDIQGLTLSDGSPIPIDYPPTIFEVFVNNGEGFPTFKGVITKDLQFTGTEKKRIEMSFVGADSGPSEVRFGQFDIDDENQGKFEVVEAGECSLKPREEKTCWVDIKPNKETYGIGTLSLNTEFVGADDKAADKKILLEDIQTEKLVNAWPGILAALALLVSFFIVQGVVRFGISVLLSRFAALSATSARARFEASVDSTGVVTLNPKRVPVDRIDQGFAIENQESTSSFVVFGFTFECSPWRTFRKSTSRPLGDVVKEGFVVVGSRGFRGPKRGMSPIVGMVELSLAGQWAVAVSENDLQRLVDGAQSVDAEVVAYLAPLTQTELSVQELNLGMEIASSNASGDLSTLIERLRQEALDALEEEESASGAIESNGGGSVPAGQSDWSKEFGVATSTASSDADPAERERGRRTRRRSNKRRDGTSGPDPSGATPPSFRDQF